MANRKGQRDRCPVTGHPLTKDGEIYLPGAPKKISDEEVWKLANIGCTHQEIADWFKTDPSFITLNYGTIIREGRSGMKMSLRRQQLTSAQNGNVQMQIWLGKNILKQSDQPKEVEDEIEQIEFVLIDSKE